MRAPLISVAAGGGRPSAPVAIALTEHAILRFQERVRPGLGFRQARQELTRLVAMGTVSTQPPAWFGHHDGRFSTRYLSVGDLVIPLVCVDGRLMALTCVPRGSVSALTRADRNVNRRRSHAKSHHPARSRRPGDDWRDIGWWE